jgi:hypothetical protein
MLYRRKEARNTLEFRIDQLAIYLATIYPLVYWHTYPRNFEWFSDVQIFHIPNHWPELLCRWLTIAVFAAFTIKECISLVKTRQVNLGKCMLLYATAAAWGTGIILFNGDLTFTLINIVSHGIPYMALIWVYQYRKRSAESEVRNRFLTFFQLKYVPIYLGVLAAFAYFEEAIWDRLVWKEHADIFGPIEFPVSATVLMVLVPLLTMPQITHYVLDAYIWRVSKKEKQQVQAVIG